MIIDSPCFVSILFWILVEWHNCMRHLCWLLFMAVCSVSWLPIDDMKRISRCNGCARCKFFGWLFMEWTLADDFVYQEMLLGNVHCNLPYVTLVRDAIELDSGLVGEFCWCSAWPQCVLSIHTCDRCSASILARRSIKPSHTCSWSARSVKTASGVSDNTHMGSMLARISRRIWMHKRYANFTMKSIRLWSGDRL